MGQVAPEDVSKFGILRPGKENDDGTLAVDGLVEKPKREDAPSNLASYGRYVFQPEVFDILRGLKPGAGGEIQLADAIDILAAQGKVSAIVNQSQRFDCGSKHGYLQAIMDVALDDPKYRDFMLALMREKLDLALR